MFLIFCLFFTAVMYLPNFYYTAVISCKKGFVLWNHLYKKRDLCRMGCTRNNLHTKGGSRYKKKVFQCTIKGCFKNHLYKKISVTPVTILLRFGKVGIHPWVGEHISSDHAFIKLMVFQRTEQLNNWLSNVQESSCTKNHLYKKRDCTCDHPIEVWCAGYGTLSRRGQGSTRLTSAWGK